MDINNTTLRKILSEFATGVCIVAVGDDPKNILGVTINSFTSVSMEPPLVMYCMKTKAESFEKVMKFPKFSINILAHDHDDLAMKCVMRGGHVIETSQFEFSKSGIPFLSDSIASIECEVETTYPGGDHTIILGKVIALNHPRDTKPLIFHRSKFLRPID